MTHQHADQEIKRKSATRPPETASPSPQLDGGNLANLQSVVGNQAVQRLMAEGRLSVGSGVVQAKLTVGAPDDQYEQEADSVAQQVMTMPDAVQRDPLAAEEDELQMKRIQRADIPEEDELQMKRIQRADMPEEDELQMKRLQREDMPEEEELQMKSASGEVPEVTSDLESSIEGARGSGQSMPDSARAFFEPRFGQDFSGVQIHTGAEADSLNRSLEARAFTTGSDIFFRDGEYNPDSSGGRELLAHELTHVVQQGGSVQKKRDDREAQ